MELTLSNHWKLQQKFRPDITDEAITYAIINSDELKDRHWPDALNVISKVPPTGKILKVVYKRISIGKVKIITAFWLD
ncbi:MAG: hypothetical protein HY516_03120 [Candidatus Aenigmarchaeota archaeon]|nr:hypothetical protein [Candidatus Aenigmarchaeota archaeon]